MCLTLRHVEVAFIKVSDQRHTVRVERADVATSQVQACVQACRTCGAECERHAGHMEHCKVCASACRECQQACEGLLRRIAA